MQVLISDNRIITKIESIYNLSNFKIRKKNDGVLNVRALLLNPEYTCSGLIMNTQSTGEDLATNMCRNFKIV